jgi:hypothetical protein
MWFALSESVLRARISAMSKQPTPAWRRAKRKRLVAQGLCMTCGQRPFAFNRKQCQQCLDVRSENWRRRRRDQLLADPSRCVQCGVNPRLPGLSQCGICKTRVVTYRDRLKQKALNGYGGQCNCCGEKEPLFLTIDHINGRGGNPREASRAVYAKVVKLHFPPDFQCLCMNCNWAKGIFGACPHQAARAAAE